MGVQHLLICNNGGVITGDATYMFAFGSLRPQNLEFSLNNPDLVHLGVAADP